MKPLSLALGAWLCFAVPSHAALFSFGFSGVIDVVEPDTDWSDSYHVGDLWSESYAYESPSIDIAFSDDNPRFGQISFRVDGGILRTFFWKDPHLETFIEYSSVSGAGDYQIDGLVWGIVTAINQPRRVSPVPDSGAPLSLALLALAPMARRSRFRRSRSQP